MKFARWGFGLLLTLTLGLAHAAEEVDSKKIQVDSDGWYVVKHDKRRDIKSWARQEDEKRLRSFKVSGTLEGKADDLVRVLLDFESYKQWFWSVRETKLLKQVSPTEYYVHMVHRAPYPVTDRDTVLHAKIKPQSKKDPRVVLTVSAVPDYLPPQAGLVRMAAEEFTVVFLPQPGNKIDIQVDGYIDPGGRVPAWAANLVQRAAPYHTVRGMHRMMEKPELLDQSITSPFPIYDYEQLKAMMAAR